MNHQRELWLSVGPVTNAYHLELRMSILHHACCFVASHHDSLSLILQIAHHYHKTPAQIMLRWGLQKGFIILPKSVTPQRILQNIQVGVSTWTSLEQTVRSFSQSQSMRSSPEVSISSVCVQSGSKSLGPVCRSRLYSPFRQIHASCLSSPAVLAFSQFWAVNSILASLLCAAYERCH